VNSFSIAAEHKGVDGACFNKIGFPKINGEVIDLNGIQKGKFHGTISMTGPNGSY
jgi:hypothetical protein